MPTHPNVVARVPPELLEAARVGAGLPPDIPVSHIMRYGLALMAGEADPLKVAKTAPPHYTRKPDTPAEARARAAYRASMAAGTPIARGELARRYQIAVHRARLIVADCKAEHRAAAA